MYNVILVSCLNHYLQDMRIKEHSKRIFKKYPYIILAAVFLPVGALKFSLLFTTFGYQYYSAAISTTWAVMRLLIPAVTTILEIMTGVYMLIKPLRELGYIFSLSLLIAYTLYLIYALIDQRSEVFLFGITPIVALVLLGVNMVLIKVTIKSLFKAVSTEES
jgi:hypothetical protein